jgi:3-methylcrotonyl-CoA carboxylase alpha subunit
VIGRLLIANRGEIAVRVARGAHEMGIVPLGIYSEADADAYHLSVMAEAVCVGPATAADSYLNIENVIAAAKTMRADAVHPGYGFLSERAAFAQAVRDAGMIFVGPAPDAMSAMGSKRDAKQLVRTHDVPVVPGYEGADQAPKTLRAEAEKIGVPLLIKASAGGGGRGMRVVDDLKSFDEALEGAKREAKAAFGDDTVLLERYLRRPRHIEFQVLADAHGNTIHFGERECSIQRRHQKIIEEAPSVALTPQLRAEMGAAAVRAAQAVKYVNAGTVEFMLDEDGKYYFLEMNTRLQVEHPVTELAYGVDLVAWQLRIANGERLTIEQEDISPRGWSIEARIYAEDPYNNMLPSTGTITAWEAPQGPGIRCDAGVEWGSEVSVYYDPMLAKLIVWGTDRAHAVRRMHAALDDFLIAGVRTNIPLLSWIVRDEHYKEGKTTTQFLPERLDPKLFAKRTTPRQALALAAAAFIENNLAPWRIGGVGMPLCLSDGEHTYSLEASLTNDPRSYRLNGDLTGTLTIDSGSITWDGKRLDGTAIAIDDDAVEVLYAGSTFSFTFANAPSVQSSSQGGAAVSGRITSPMPGKIVKIAVKAGDAVEDHALLLVLEAMKMEHRIEAPSAGTVKSVFVKEGELVTGSAPLVELE